MVRLFLVKNIQIINWGTLQTRLLVLTNAGRLEQIQKTENIWQILCQDLEKDDLRHDRALNPCERMKSLTWDLLNKESKDTNVSGVSQSEMIFLWENHWWEHKPGWKKSLVFSLKGFEEYSVLRSKLNGLRCDCFRVPTSNTLKTLGLRRRNWIAIISHVSRVR